MVRKKKKIQGKFGGYGGEDDGDDASDSDKEAGRFYLRYPLGVVHWATHVVVVTVDISVDVVVVAHDSGQGAVVSTNRHIHILLQVL